MAHNAHTTDHWPLVALKSKLGLLHFSHIFFVITSAFFNKFNFNRVSSSIVLLHCGIITQEMSFYLNFMGYGIHMLLVSPSFAICLIWSIPYLIWPGCCCQGKEGNICRPAEHRWYHVICSSIKDPWQVHVALAALSSGAATLVCCYLLIVVRLGTILCVRFSYSNLSWPGGLWLVFWILD